MNKGIKMEAVASFVKLVERHLHNYQADNRLRVVRHEDLSQKTPVGWYKVSTIPCSDYSIEIHNMENCKRQNLVGVANFKLKIQNTSVYASKQEAEQCEVFDTKIESHRHTFSYKQGSWQVQSREHSEAVLMITP